MPPYRHLFAAASLLLLSAGVARAQVVDSTQTKPELNALPPDRPVLDTTPRPVRPTPPPTSQPAEPSPVQPPAVPNPGTFTPARPPQPTALPTPPKRPTPENVGTIKPEMPTSNLLESGKWFVLANPSLNFSSVNGISRFQIGGAAMLGYRITDRFAIGPGVNYQYYSIGSYSLSNYGGRVFAQGIITDNFFVHAEHEVLRAPYYERATGVLYVNRKATINSTFAGLGYRQHIGSRAAADLMALYNFSYDSNFYLYSQPEIRLNLLFDLF